ncbi:MAG: hypothetical protein KJZ70_16185 [Bryobacterales bacterium]|nr:hypothetical protein [Bryobacterales bacterium]
MPEHASKDPPIRVTSMANETGQSDGMDPLDRICGHRRVIPAPRQHRGNHPAENDPGRGTLDGARTRCGFRWIEGCDQTGNG